MLDSNLKPLRVLDQEGFKDKAVTITTGTKKNYLLFRNEILVFKVYSPL